MLNATSISKLINAIGSAFKATSALRAHRCLLYLFALDAFIFMEQQYGGIRFTNPALNAALNAVLVPLFFALPCLMVLILLCGRELWSKICGIVLAVFVSVFFWMAIPSTFMGFGCDLMRTSGDSPFHVNHSIQMRHSTVVVYSDSPGAFASYLVHVDEERTLLPGLKWIRYLATAQGEDATIMQLDSHHIRCEFNNDVASQPDKVFYIE